MKLLRYLSVMFLVCFASGAGTTHAQQNIAQEAYLIFEKSCLGCHGPHGPFTEQLVIESASGLIDIGAVVPGAPLVSELYTRLTTIDTAKRMPLNQPKLDEAAIDTIAEWILAGAPSWELQHDVDFISTDAMLTSIQNHLKTLDAFSRPFARYFTMTHLYNTGVGPAALRAYRVALSKLVNSLSWGFDIINPQPIDASGTLFHIDLRDYEWDTRDAWTQIETVYPYTIDFDETQQRQLHNKLAVLREDMACEVPFVYADWFLATASLPPLYHDILALPETEQALERELGINVARNLQAAPGVRVWRAGTNNSGVSNHNRVVERHTSRYGAYWKSHDFASSVGRKNIFLHPLSFDRDGGEVIFNLPNGLQAYYISDGAGNRIDVAPTEIVSNPAASDPAVRNGLSCIGCHTEGMKDFEDGVRAVVNQTQNPAYDKDHALRLYVEQTEMNVLVAEDTVRYEDALAKTGGVSGGIEPVHRFYEVYQGPVTVQYAAAAVGMEPTAFISQVQKKSSLQRLGLAALANGGNVKRDVWTAQFSDVVSALQSPDVVVPEPSRPTRQVPPVLGSTVSLPDVNLRAAIAERLGKAPNALITPDDMKRLTELFADEKGIRDLTGLEYATNLERIELENNAISDLTPLIGLVRLNNIKLHGNRISDVLPLAGLVNVDWMGLEENQITDLSPLAGLKKLNGIGISGNPITDISSLASMTRLEGLAAWNTSITDFSALAKLPRLRWIEFGDNASITTLPSLKGLKTLRRLEISTTRISDISGLSVLTQLQELTLHGNLIKDISPLAKLKGLTRLNLSHNVISDVSPLAGLTQLEYLNLRDNAISDFSVLKALSEKILIRTQGNPGSLLQGGPKIAGPWLWLVIPGAQHADLHNKGDLLARMSGGDVTVRKISTNGAVEGQSVGDSVWISHKIDPYGNNINRLLEDLGISKDRNLQYVVYGSLTLNSLREQSTKMFAGSDDTHKIWLNGSLVNTSHDHYDDYQQSFPVTLKKGKNVLLVAVHDWVGGFSGHFGFAPDAVYAVIPQGSHFSLATDATTFQKDDRFTLRLTAAEMSDLAGYQTDITFDPDVLRANGVTEGGFLKQKNGRTHFFKGTINNKIGRITGLSATRLTNGGATGDGTLLAINFTVKQAKNTRVRLRNFKAGDSTGKPIAATIPEFRIRISADTPTAIPAWDVNEDGMTDLADQLIVIADVRKNPPANPRSDVNGDGVVDEKDVALVANHLGEKNNPAAPSNLILPANITFKVVQDALDLLRAADDGSLLFRGGIAKLEMLLALFVPEETALLHNYPNPFNPETWIPYQLAEPSEVTLHIYTVSGALVRTLDLGHQPAGIYQYRSRAAYWDGKNELGEPVASGVYFYTLTAGDFAATRKMFITK